MKQSTKIIFFGSGPVAAATLGDIANFFDIEAIITKPRPEGHRGEVPVLEFATDHKITTFTVSNKAELDSAFSKNRFTSQVGLVVDFGIIISQMVINCFKKGIINSHFSLLPQWRGADPISFAILSGQPTTGVSLMLINNKLDEGKLISVEELPIKPDETTPELTTRLIALSSKMLERDLPKYLSGALQPYDQPQSPVTYSRKLTKEDSVLDFNKPAAVLEREIRGFSGWPKSHLELFGHRVVVLKARIARSNNDGALVLPCAQSSFLEILEVKAPSGKTITGAAFLNGYKK